MKIEIITNDKLTKYMTYLTNEEFFGVIYGRITCFGVFDESADEIMGVLSAEILPEYIHIMRCFVLPNYRGKGAGRTLVSGVTDISEDIRLPFIFYDTDDKINGSFLEAVGFKRRSDTYSYIKTRLANIKEGPLPKIDKDIEFYPADQVSNRLVGEYVFNSKKDTFLQIPEITYDSSRFSDGSVVCIKNGRVVALVLMEEKDDYIIIPYIEADDLSLVYHAFYLLKDKLLDDYALGEEIRFLICNKTDKELVEDVVTHSDEKRIRIYEKK